MTKEENELLLKDLSGRLPYGVKTHIEHDVFYDEIEPYDCTLTPKILDDFLRMERLEVKPYLHPMSSMTEEEYEDFIKVLKRSMVCRKCYDLHEQWIQSPSVEEWLNEHHFDYRMLIEKSLALEAPEGMYNIQTDLT